MRFLFCSLDSPGFLDAAMGLAMALRRRGHTIAFACNTACSDQLNAEGIERIPRGAHNDGPSFRVKDWGLPLSIALQVKHIEYAISRFFPDVLVGQQLTLGALIAGERHRVPVALLGFCTYLWPTHAPSEEYSAGGQLKAWRLRDFTGRVNDARELIKLPTVKSDVIETPLLGDLFLIRSVPELEGDMDLHPCVAHLVGDCLWEPEIEDPELDRWLSDSERRDWPLVYVHHGRVFDGKSFWEPLVDGVAKKKIRVVASVGRMDRPVGPLPANVYAAACVPQSRILQGAQAMVATANTTAVLGAMKAGVPSLLIAAGGEHPDVAEKCVRAGTSRMLRDDQVSADLLFSELTVVLEDGYLRESAQFLAAAFKRYEDHSVAAHLLETLAVTKEPVRRPAVCEVFEKLSVGAGAR